MILFIIYNLYLFTWKFNKIMPEFVCCILLFLQSLCDSIIKFINLQYIFKQDFKLLLWKIWINTQVHSTWEANSTQVLDVHERCHHKNINNKIHWYLTYLYICIIVWCHNIIILDNTPTVIVVPRDHISGVSPIPSHFWLQCSVHCRGL